jgi:antitoxin MazE
MQTVVRKIGNSSGIVLPKAVLSELGVKTGEALDVRIEGGRIIAMPIKGRSDWAAAAQAIGAQSDSEADEWSGFGNADDDKLAW